MLTETKDVVSEPVLTETNDERSVQMPVQCSRYNAEQTNNTDRILPSSSAAGHGNRQSVSDDLE